MKLKASLVFMITI